MGLQTINDPEGDFQILQQRGLLAWTEKFNPELIESYRARVKASNNQIRIDQNTLGKPIGKHVEKPKKNYTRRYR